MFVLVVETDDGLEAFGKGLTKKQADTIQKNLKGFGVTMKKMKESKAMSTIKQQIEFWEAQLSMFTGETREQRAAMHVLQGRIESLKNLLSSLQS